MGVITILDLAVLSIIALSTYLGYKKGFVHTLFNLFSLFISLYLVSIFSPMLSAFFIGTTNLFYNLRDYIIDIGGISEHVESMISSQQADIISNIPLPNFLITMINENYRLEIHNLLDTRAIEEYIAGLLATVIINIVSFVITFFTVSISLGLISGSLHVLVKLPMIRSLNKSLGALLGAIRSLIFIWVGLMIYTLLLIGIDTNSAELLQDSRIALFFYEQNILLELIVNMFI